MSLNTEIHQSLKQRLLICALNEFAEHGYEGARVENIVNAAGCSKQTVYHHYGNKEKLFIAVLEYSWNDIRTKEQALQFNDDDPRESLSRIIEFTWRYYLENPWFLKIVNSENQSKGVHLRKSAAIKAINEDHLTIMHTIIAAGINRKIFRPDMDPVQVNISIAALGFFYLINQHTLGHIYNMQMTSEDNLNKRLAIIKDTILRWVCV